MSRRCYKCTGFKPIEAFQRKNKTYGLCNSCSAELKVKYDTQPKIKKPASAETLQKMSVYNELYYIKNKDIVLLKSRARQTIARENMYICECGKKVNPRNHRHIESKYHTSRMELSKSSPNTA